MRKLLFVSAGVLACLATSTFAATTWNASLAGSNEVPPTGSSAIGSAILSLNGTDLSVSLTFSGLSAPATASHIHCCAAAGSTAGVALAFPGFPATISGTYTNTFDLTLSSTYTSAFVTTSGGTAADAEAAILSAFDNGLAYVNIHDANFPGGEIRGQVAAVPEPASFVLSLGGLAALAIFRRRKV